MKREEIEETVKDFLQDFDIDSDAIKPEALLKDDLGLDSLDFVDIVVVVEKNFGFKIKAEEMADVLTVGQFYDYIQSKVSE